MFMYTTNKFYMYSVQTKKFHMYIDKNQIESVINLIDQNA